ncbi:MAG TPA: class A beta-lactamase [Terricaulis sp.]|nr:class A beta-lactamase [Terricaulis sp.]
MWTRRGALAGAAALAACAPVRGGVAVAQQDDPRFAAIEARVGGRVGVYALNTADGAMLSHRGDERFAMCSTFKWLLAAGVLHYAARGGPQLDDPVRFDARDIVTYSPRVEASLARGVMRVEELCEATVTISDNAAANLLLVGMMGTEGFTRFVRGIGDAVTRLDRLEPALNANTPGDERDTTTPSAMAHTMRRLLAEEAQLSAVAREKLLGWMIASPTGLSRLRAGLPEGWRAGDKTGTSDGANNATNDVMIAWPPGRPPILITCYLSHSTAPMADRNAAHAEIARIVTESWS